jgi:uncharacterized protein involved in exopolysaccharide biosynthesis
MPDEGPTRRGRELPAPTVRELAMVVFRQRRVFLCVSALVLGIALLYTFMGARYQAHLKIMVRQGRADVVATAGENAPIDIARMAITEEDLNSEVELLKDEKILRKVVEVHHLAGRDWLHFLRMGEGRATQIERATRRLAGKLCVEPVKKTNLIAVSYESDDPAVAARVLQSLATLYLEKHMEVHRPVGEFQFFEQQTDESRRQLEDAKQKLLQFVSSHGVVAAAQERDLALQKLSDEDASYRQAQVDLEETDRRIQELGRQMPTLQERATTQVRIADNPELLKALKSSLLELELKRTQLLTKFEPNHRLVLELDQQIVQAKSTIAAEMLAPLRDETTDKDPNYEWAKAELQRARVQFKGLDAKAAATRRQAAAYRSQAAQLGRDALTQDSLLSAEKAALDNYLLYVKKREEARVGDALDQRGIVNVAIAERPVAPLLPVRSAWMLLAISFAVAGASGTTAAFAVDYWDPAFRTPDEVLAYLNAPVLASLPRKAKLLSA